VSENKSITSQQYLFHCVLYNFSIVDGDVFHFRFFVVQGQFCEVGVPVERVVGVVAIRLGLLLREVGVIKADNGLGEAYLRGGDE
jgi:hypothetical protein